ncbi:hypothetical protein PP715_23290 [Ralstonia solanacearum]|nr:hypothetical protein [Ralstonia solanacearum]MDC6265741.1 hypothetical protein [Ralstonia solanacearum]MDC6320536.1 hypothetical protein [Ralstonia solanacearum]
MRRPGSSDSPPPPGELGIAAAIDEVAAPTEEQIEEVLAEAGV